MSASTATPEAVRGAPPPGEGALAALRSPTGIALIAAKVLASMVGFLDANVNVAPGCS